MKQRRLDWEWFTNQDVSGEMLVGRGAVVLGGWVMVVLSVVRDSKMRAGGIGGRVL